MNPKIFITIVITFLLTMFLASLWCPCVNAQSAIVTFDDEEHLQALTDSITSVCDTTTRIDTTIETGWWRGPEENPGHWEETDEITIKTRTTITCRRLVCVVAKWPETVADATAVSYDGFFDDLFPTKNIPGKAIIFYERVKQCSKKTAK